MLKPFTFWMETCIILWITTMHHAHVSVEISRFSQLRSYVYRHLIVKIWP